MIPDFPPHWVTEPPDASGADPETCAFVVGDREPLCLLLRNDGMWLVYPPTAELPAAVVHKTDDGWRWWDCNLDPDSNPLEEPMPETYVSRVATTIGGGFTQDYGRLTLFVGPSAAGKTMRVRALQHLVAGGAGDVQWRPWCGGALLGTLTADGSMPETSGILVRDGAEYPVTAADAVGTVLGFDEVRTALTGSADRARLFFAKLLRVEADVVHAEIGKALRREYEEAAQTLDAATPLGTLLAVRSAADDAMRRANAQVKMLVEALRLASTDEAPTEMDERAAQVRVEAAAGALREARETAKAAREASHQIALRARLDRDIDVLKARLGEAPDGIAAREDQVRQAHAALAALPPPAASDMVHVHTVLAEAARLHIAHTARRCALCRTDHDPDALAETSRAVIARAERAVTAQADAVRHETQRARLQAAVNTAEAALAVYRDTVAGWKAQGRALLAERKALPPDLPHDDGGDTEADYEAAQAAYTQANITLERIRTARAQAVNTRDLREQRDAAQDAAQRAKAVKARAAEAYDVLYNKAVAGFIARVNAYLPDGLTFTVRLDPFVWGLQREIDGEPVVHSAPSGGEGVILLTAIACAYAEQHDHLVLVIPEERGIDAHLLRAFMTRLAEKAPPNVQVVLTNIVPPFRGAVKGWTICALGEGA